MFIANINLIFLSSFQDTDFKQEMFTSLAREILAASQSEQVKNFLLKIQLQSEFRIREKILRIRILSKNNIPDPDPALILKNRNKSACMHDLL